MTKKDYAILTRWHKVTKEQLRNQAMVNKLCIYAEVEIDNYKAQLQDLEYLETCLPELNHILDKLQQAKSVLRILHSIQ
jgi:hypothetical protein